MSTLSIVQPIVNDPVPIEAVIEWAEKQAEKGDMGGASARLRLTSLRQIAEQVAADEPKDARWILTNIERLRDRWARKNVGNKSDTAKTYASRAKTTIEEYLRWSAAPGDYDPKRREPRPKADAASKKTVATKASVSAPETPPVAQTTPTVAAPTAQTEFRSCPLGPNRDPFRYQLPAEGLQVKDALRVAYHLITTCDDYDPMVSPVQVFSNAIQRTQ